jgi:uncharacterized protein YjbI with pentapeptide repeats
LGATDREALSVLLIADVGATVTVVTAIAGAVVAILGVMGYQNRRAKLAAVRGAFNDAIAALASGNRDQQLAGAVLLRRFFDPSSEFRIRDLIGRRRCPYAKEAIDVITAVLRGLPKGDLQKVLADGLAYAPTLKRADLQNTNLQGAYLSPQREKATLESADFYRANVSGGSLKKAKAVNAQFYQTQLRDTVFTDADLRCANFFEADLLGAVFTGAQLHGADFRGARNLPPELESCLTEGKYTSSDRGPRPSNESSIKRSVFLIVPFERTPPQETLVEKVVGVLADVELQAKHLPRSDYPASDALSSIQRQLQDCAGVVVFGFGSQSHDGSEQSACTRPWIHLEAGMAYGCNVPLLLVREEGVNCGVFDDAVRGHRTHILDVAEARADTALTEGMQEWVHDVRR